jgi:hypothetical protein
MAMASGSQLPLERNRAAVKSGCKLQRQMNFEGVAEWSISGGLKNEIAVLLFGRKFN